MIRGIREPLRAFLRDDTGIAARVGTSPPLIFAFVIPQGVVDDCIVYNRISSTGDHHMRGPSGYTAVRMQVVAWSRRQGDAESLAALVKFRLDGFRGRWQSATSPAEFPPVKVQGVFFETDNPPNFDEALKLFGIGHDFMIHYAER